MPDGLNTYQVQITDFDLLARRSEQTIVEVYKIQARTAADALTIAGVKFELYDIPGLGYRKITDLIAI